MTKPDIEIILYPLDFFIVEKQFLIAIEIIRGCGEDNISAVTKVVQLKGPITEIRCLKAYLLAIAANALKARKMDFLVVKTPKFS